jgi:hypothetical protein
VIRQPTPFADRQFEIQCLDAGAEDFSFTFGRSREQNRQNIKEH